jgi:hypothetical protein
MPTRFFHDPPRQQEGSPEFTRILFLFFGVAALLGLVSGSIWIAWNLIRLHLLHW